MADAGFRLRVLTEQKTVMEESVLSVTAPGTEGYLGVLRSHAPLITGLTPGKLSVRTLDDQVREYAVAGGFMEVSRNTATLLADALEPVADIDIPRAEAAAGRARERLAKKGGGDIDVERAETALSRALNRIRLSRQGRSR